MASFYAISLSAGSNSNCNESVSFPLTPVIVSDNIFAGDISRIFYFTYSKETIVLLSAFVKKTMKTPQIELDRALK